MCATNQIFLVARKGQEEDMYRAFNEDGDSQKRYFVYWIQSSNRAYIGATVDPPKRLRQHNGEIAGGAARTRNRGPWHFECVISGFRTWKEALQYEWAAKYYSRACRGVCARRKALEALKARERWTSNSPLACEVPLSMEYKPSAYGMPPATYPVHQPNAPVIRRRRHGSTTRRKFKKTLVHKFLLLKKI